MTAAAPVAPDPAGEADVRIGPIAVVVAAPLALRRAALAEALGAIPDLDVVARVDELPRLAESAADHRADVVVLEAGPGVPVAIALDACRAATASARPPRVLLVHEEIDTGLVPAALRAGAFGVFDATQGLDLLERAVRSLHRGEAWLSRAQTGALLRALHQGPGPAGDDIDLTQPSLTRRELEILCLMVDGLDHTAIAERLFLSPHTARTHIRNVLRKLGARGRVDAVRIAIDSGLVEPRDRDPRVPPAT